MIPSISKQLDICFNGTDKELNFNLRQLISGKTIEIDCIGIYPTQEEIVFNKFDKNHIIRIGNEEVQVKSLPSDLNEKQIKRTHIVQLETLHVICLQNYAAYIEHENIEDKSIITSRIDFLKEFRKYYDIIINLSNDGNVKRDYRRYWREVSFNNSLAIRPGTLFNAVLNESSKQLIKSTLYSLSQSL